MKLMYFFYYVVCASVGFADDAGCASEKNLEWFLLLDASEGFQEQGVVTFDLVEKTGKDLLAEFNSVRFGLGSFTDKPIHPFGFADDFCFALQSGLRPFFVDDVVEAFKRIVYGSGNDLKESQLDAMYRSIILDQVSWSSPNAKDTLKVLTVITKDGFHVEGDPLEYGMELPRFKKDRRLTSCNASDYVSVRELANIVELEDIFVIFIVDKGSVQIYGDLLSNLGNFGVVISYEDINVEDMSLKIEDAIRRACIADSIPAAHFISNEDIKGLQYKQCGEPLRAALPKDALLVGVAETMEMCSHIVQSKDANFVSVAWKVEEGDDYQNCYGSFLHSYGETKEYLSCDLDTNHLDKILDEEGEGE
eukprot:GHVP01060204.1.p1 GENE.GHVP01060204.1~~GHVP01060204.1.p1  ORF type:complete len:363 (+),score=56.16 GHVP01060204.1:933-2021(+)